MEKKIKFIDCRWFPNDSGCTLTISGSEEEVIKAATEHAVSTHGEKDTPEFRKKIRQLLKKVKD